MSMISSQCDELRDWACELRNLANGPVNEGFPARANLFKSADAMCQAADTIWELSCKLAGVVDQCDEIERLKAENAKLRELVCKWYPHMLKRVGRDALKQWGQLDVVKELGIEVIDG